MSTTVTRAEAEAGAGASSGGARHEAAELEAVSD